MKIIENPFQNDFKCDWKELALTVGNFDGVHLGHQYLLKQLDRFGMTKGLFTFRNHPTSVLKPDSAVKPLGSFAEKVTLLEKCGIDILCVTDFTKSFADYSAEQFLNLLRDRLQVRHLILGEGAHLGNNREGSPEALQRLAQPLNISVHYIQPLYREGAVVSSTRIRQLIATGNCIAAEQLLGRSKSFDNVG